MEIEEMYRRLAILAEMVAYGETLMTGTELEEMRRSEYLVSRAEKAAYADAASGW